MQRHIPPRLKRGLQTGLALLFGASLTVQAAKPIIHDAEHAVLQAQNGQTWAQQDKALDQRLAQLEKRFGTPPNIIHIMWDDAGYGQLGNPHFSKMHGLDTPRIEQLAEEGLSFVRMYTEIACTQSRAAAQTGRLAARSGMYKVVFPPDGMGLADEEVTIAEVMSQSGYQTAFYGKWHLGDIEESYAHKQGYDEALFMPYNQWPPMMYNAEAEEQGWTWGFTPDTINARFSKDSSFRYYDYVFSVEGKKGGKAREFVRGDHDGYDQFNNVVYQRSLDFIRKNAKAGKPFYLSWYPNEPHDYGRHENYENVGRGDRYASGFKKFDRRIGKLLDLLQELGIAENTLVVLMADNGPMTEVKPNVSINSLFRGGKGDFLEGGVRVPAFAWWPGTIKADSVVGDIIHITDLFTTFARLGGATKYIPRDRVIDGVDQTALLLNGEGNSRRDYIHIYRGPYLAATVKEQFKRHWAGERPGLMGKEFFDLYKDPREEHPVMAQMLWSWTAFDKMKHRHQQQLRQYPLRKPVVDTPVAGIDRLEGGSGYIAGAQ